MSKILVIGNGNPLRGDDGVGWFAVDELMNVVRDPAVESIKCRELTPELSPQLRAY